MTDQAARLIEMWRIDAESREKTGVYYGSLEAFASMVIYGECTIMGRTLPVHFDWPTERFFDLERGPIERRDERFYEQVRQQCIEVLKIAHAAGRQQNPPPE
jgi:hypothetical protein